VAKKLLKHVGLEVGMVYGRRGKAQLPGVAVKRPYPP
jgi:hypothetical protein